MNFLLGVVGLLLVVGIFVILYFTVGFPDGNVSNFEECVSSGGAVMESFPRQCDINGITYVEQLHEVGIANPASIYCEEQGGTLEVRTGDLGSVGYCKFDDGTECEEWAYFRGECRATE